MARKVFCLIKGWVENQIFKLTNWKTIENVWDELSRTYGPNTKFRLLENDFNRLKIYYSKRIGDGWEKRALLDEFLNLTGVNDIY